MHSRMTSPGYCRHGNGSEAVIGTAPHYRIASADSRNRTVRDSPLHFGGGAESGYLFRVDPRATKSTNSI